MKNDPLNFRSGVSFPEMSLGKTNTWQSPSVGSESRVKVSKNQQ